MPWVAALSAIGVVARMRTEGGQECPRSDGSGLRAAAVGWCGQEMGGMGGMGSMGAGGGWLLGVVLFGSVEFSRRS